MCLLLATAVAILRAGCDSPFVPESVLASFRTIAVRAEPPEARPGETVVLDALVFDPASRAISVTWFACDPPAAEGVLTPCDDTRVVEDLAAKRDPTSGGIREVGTSTRATYVYAGDLGGALERRAIILHVARAGDETRISRKEIVLSVSPSPNHNPAIELIVVEGRPIGPTDLGSARAGDSLELSGIVTSSSAEMFALRRADGSEAPHVEDVRLEWFTTQGRYGVDYRPPSAKPIIDLFVDSGPPPPDVGPREGGGESSKDEFGMKVTLNLPKPDEVKDDRLRVFVVVRDTRGGTDWEERGVVLRP